MTVVVIQRAYEEGINYYDLATAEGRTFSYFGTALGAVRKNVHYQVHFGVDYASGTYGWSTDGETIRRSVAWQLAQLKTDYIDYGFIHCIDELSDWQEYQQNGTFAYLMQMREQGGVKHIGLSVVIPFGMFLWRKESGKVLEYLEPINQIKIKGGFQNGSKTDSRQRFAG